MGAIMVTIGNTFWVAAANQLAESLEIQANTVVKRSAAPLPP